VAGADLDDPLGLRVAHQTMQMRPSELAVHAVIEAEPHAGPGLFGERLLGIELLSSSSN